MKTARHTIYTEIPLRSFNALVGDKETIENLLIALMVDEFAAEDVAEQIANQSMPRPDVSAASFFDLGANAWDAWKATVSQWASRQVDARRAIRGITIYNRKLGVWCGCWVVRRVLPLVPAEDRTPRLAIETTESRLVGRSTLNNLREVSRAVKKMIIPFSDPGIAMNDAVAAAYAVTRAGLDRNELNNESAAADLEDAVRCVAEAELAGDGLSMNDEKVAEQLTILLPTVAEACFYFPEEAMR